MHNPRGLHPDAPQPQGLVHDTAAGAMARTDLVSTPAHWGGGWLLPARNPQTATQAIRQRLFAAGMASTAPIHLLLAGEPGPIAPR